MITLRKAEDSDVKFIFDLRNEPVVRAVSFDSSLIGFPSHCEWFKKKIRSSNASFVIPESDGVPMGQVRLDLSEDKNGGEIGVALAPEFRGKGYAPVILLLAADWFFAEFPSIKYIDAYIKTDNMPSLRSFEKAGYVVQEKVSHSNCDCIRMRLTR